MGRKRKYDYDSMLNQVYGGLKVTKMLGKQGNEVMCECDCTCGNHGVFYH
jgi:hypothetical protein